ncbi:MAG: Hsp20/alpha crystallin family protein [Halobacteriota archaeon]
MKPKPFREMEEFVERMSTELPGMPSPPQVDLVERADEYVLRADLPGFDRDEIDLTLRDRTLTIRADRAEATSEADAHFVRQERRQHSITRAIQLPEAVDAEGVTATYERGVLEVHLPRPEAEETHTIDVS